MLDADARRVEEAELGGLITVAVEQARYDYHVRRGDTLSKIAKDWLGDSNRWPDICGLNKHRHFPGGRSLTDCDLIFPGWELRLPATAVPPTHARPTPPRRTPAPQPTKPEQAPPRPGDRPPATPGPVTESVGTDHSTPASPTSSPANDDQASEHAEQDLTLAGGNIIPWALACAIAATAALVWLQRRRRYVPGTHNHDDLPNLPDPVLAAQHHTRHATPPQPAETLFTPWLPSGGVGLIGAGADAVTRGLIITALTSGSPTDPAHQAVVIIDRHTLTAVLGETPITAWPRLHITDTLDQSLTLLDTHLLHRARILDDHNLADLDAVRETDPSEEALPPLLLITGTEHATPSNRARITFGLSAGLDITTVVLGHWPPGQTLTVSDDGHANLGPNNPDSAAIQLPVLDIPTTHDLLTTAREAHTGDPAPRALIPLTPSSAIKPALTSAIAEPMPASRVDAPNTTAAGTGPKRAQLRVLGTPRIENITADGRPLRAKALELAVYLAVHPDGATTRDIGEYLEPDARISQADQRVHTNASNLRHVLRRAGATDAQSSYVIKTAGRYRLDPTAVDVDLWTLRNLLREATIAPQPRRRELLSAACRLCTAPLAEGHDYEWIPPHREAVRRWGTDAHLMLADDLIDTDPQAASDLLGKAIALDPYNETLYTKAMQVRHALGDSDGIKTLLRALTKALADLDAEPHEETVSLARVLRTTLDIDHPSRPSERQSSSSSRLAKTPPNQ